MPDATSFPDLLTTALTDRGWNQAQLTRELQAAGETLTEQAVSAWAVGRSVPGTARLPALSQVLGVDLGSLVQAIAASKAAA